MTDDQQSAASPNPGQPVVGPLPPQQPTLRPGYAAETLPGDDSVPVGGLGPQHHREGKACAEREAKEVTTIVYVLWHQHEVGESQEASLLGVYSSVENAAVALDRLKDKPGFKEHPDGFQITEYTVDRDQWPEGFISWREAL